jgi:Protein of unknown function (DUF1194)
MRARFSSFAMLAALAAGLVAVVAGSSGVATPASPPVLADRSPNAMLVDAELVLAVDVSYSMDPEEQALQREGYIAGLTSREFMQALRGGMHGRVAVTYFEWAGPFDQKIVVPWRLIDGPEAADAFANEIARAPYRRASRTSISGALNFAKPLFDGSGYRGVRRVVDISGDGSNNSGPLVTLVRDDVVASGITINGLPIMLKRPNSFTMDLERLDIYFEDCVIGGPGAFVIPIRERHQFKEAIRTKLVLEIAGRTPEPRVIPAQTRPPRISCTIGEQMWRERWGN